MSWLCAGLMLGMVMGMIITATLFHRAQQQQGCHPGDVLYPQSGGVYLCVEENTWQTK